MHELPPDCSYVSCANVTAFNIEIIQANLVSKAQLSDASLVQNYIGISSKNKIIERRGSRMSCFNSESYIINSLGPFLSSCLPKFQQKPVRKTMCKTGALSFVICQRLNTLKSLFCLLHGNCFYIFSDFVLSSAVVDLLCEETVHEQESVRSWAVKRQSSNSIKRFHGKVYKVFCLCFG